MFPNFGRRRVAPVCLGPPCLQGSDDSTESSKSRLAHTGEMVLTPSAQVQRRRSIDVITEHLANCDRSVQGMMKAGNAITSHNARQHMLVVRGPHWKWGDDDGGAGHPGRILCVDKKNGVATVFWHHTDHVHSYYRCGKQTDLSVALATRESCPPGCIIGSPEEEPKSPKGTLSKMMMVFPGRQSTLSCWSQGSIPSSSLLASRRNSQDSFSTAQQTIIVFDWDDTLFPTTYFSHGLGMNPTVPLKDQKKLAPAMRPQVGRGLMKCADTAIRLLRLANGLGKVVLVTLADKPWVELTCRSSYPMVGQALREMGIKVVYAKEACKERLRQRGEADAELFWCKIKGECIAREAQEFYSQYEGQSWKNIISIGDSQFERLGTMVSTSEYMREKGLLSEHDEVGDQEFKVRTKTFKLVGEPTLEELTCEMEMLLRWLPAMVAKDSSLDVVIDDLDNASQVQDIEDMIMKKATPPAVSGFASSGSSNEVAK